MPAEAGVNNAACVEGDTSNTADAFSMLALCLLLAALNI
jgi:hypothetical protein